MLAQDLVSHNVAKELNNVVSLFRYAQGYNPMPLLHNDTCPMRDYYVWNMYYHDQKEANYFNDGLVEPNPIHSYL